MKKVLVVVDMQNDFVTGSLGNKAAEGIVPNVVAKVEDYLDESCTVFFTMDTHYNSEYFKSEEGRNLPIKHCISGTKGWEIIDPLQKYLDNENVTIFEKETFGSVKLGETLKDYWRNIGYKDLTVEIIGLCTDICVVSNALLIKSFCEDAHIVVDSSCCAGVTKESHETALQTMRSCHIEII